MKAPSPSAQDIVYLPHTSSQAVSGYESSTSLATSLPSLTRNQVFWVGEVMAEIQEPEPSLAERMAADALFVAGAEEGWTAIDQGRCRGLGDVKRRLGDL